MLVLILENNIKQLKINLYYGRTVKLNYKKFTRNC